MYTCRYREYGEISINITPKSECINKYYRF